MAEEKNKIVYVKESLAGIENLKPTDLVKSLNGITALNPQNLQQLTAQGVSTETNNTGGNPSSSEKK